jgi:hypothetical protein
MPLLGTEHTGKVSKPYGAILRREEGHPAAAAALARGFAFAGPAAGIARRTGARSRRPVSGECRRAPRSSMKVHSAVIRLTTSSGVNIDAIASH